MKKDQAGVKEELSNDRAEVNKQIDSEDYETPKKKKRVALKSCSLTFKRK